MRAIYKIYRFYRDGFREMTVGKTLWAVILIKLFVMFVILRLLFFPSVMSQFDTPEQKSDHILEQLGERWTEVQAADGTFSPKESSSLSGHTPEQR